MIRKGQVTVMLFGRRKPGFIQVEEESPEQAAQNEAPEGAQNQEGKPELMEYLDSLPEVEDPFPPMEEEGAKEKTPAQELADDIRIRSAAAQVTAKSALEAEIEDFSQRMELLLQDETCKDIAFTTGAKETFYYSRDTMSDNYAMIAALVEEKNLAETIARMVRFNCKTYPLPTPFTYFERHPYYATRPQIERAVDVLKREPQYQDIQIFQNSDNVSYFYAEGIMSKKYAKALAETEEFTD